MFKYRYERLLGEGSNGKTYLASDLRTGTLLAIKALKLNQSENFKSFELFKREAETLSSLDVPGVPKFYESILSSEIGGECYIIQEYVDAPSIQTYLNEGRKFTEEETLMLMQKTAEILHALHTQYSPPVIHRDIKPSNILCLLPSGADWHNIKPYLIDFGAVANAHSNTDKSTIAGTIGYMAPEQNFGECLPQTDLYALGATALHMLTGVPPYDMDFDTFSLKYEEALDAHAPSTSKEMRDLLGSMLDYSYDNRPESAEALIQTLRRMIAPTPQEEAAPQSLKSASVLQRVLARIFPNLKPPLQPHEYLQRLFPPYTDLSALRYAPGTAWCYSNIQTKGNFQCQIVEYTFDANGKSWGGARQMPAVFYPQRKLTLPDDPDHVIDLEHPASLEVALQAYAQLQTLFEQKGHAPGRASLPASCIILHHVDDPSCNRLLYILNPSPDKK